MLVNAGHTPHTPLWDQIKKVRLPVQCQSPSLRSDFSVPTLWRILGLTHRCSASHQSLQEATFYSIYFFYFFIFWPWASVTHECTWPRWTSSLSLTSQITVIPISLNPWRETCTLTWWNLPHAHECTVCLNQRTILTDPDEGKIGTWSAQLTGYYILQDNQNWNLSRH